MEDREYTQKELLEARAMVPKCKDIEDMTKTDLQDILDTRNIPYTAATPKAELLALVQKPVE